MHGLAACYLDSALGDLVFKCYLLISVVFLLEFWEKKQCKGGGSSGSISADVLGSHCCVCWLWQLWIAVPGSPSHFQSRNPGIECPPCIFFTLFIVGLIINCYAVDLWICYWTHIARIVGFIVVNTIFLAISCNPGRIPGITKSSLPKPRIGKTSLGLQSLVAMWWQLCLHTAVSC